MGNNQGQEFSYGTWRTDIPQVPGHSRELICSKNVEHPGQVAEPYYQGITTLWEAFDRTVKRVPNHKFLGTRNLPDAEGKLGYSWRTF